MLLRSFGLISGQKCLPEVNACLKQIVRRVTMETSAKTATIGTHSGMFHCDDVLACYLLKQLPAYKHANIVRSRDLDVLKECDIVVDVGNVYNHASKRYDHHQKEFNHTLNSLDQKKDYHVKLSSAGLIYHHYGRQIIQNILDLKDDNEQLEIIFDKLYENFFQEIDGIDNGIEMYDGTPRYRISTDLSKRVSHLLPNWTEKTTDEILYERFLEAMKLAGREFEERVVYYGKVWYSARSLIKQAIDEKEKTHPSGVMIELSGAGQPWRDHLFALERLMNMEGVIKYVIFTQDDAWRIVAVPIEPKSFILRCPLHADWRGLRDEELAKKSGIPDAKFVHATGFIGGALTRKGVIEMGSKTLQSSLSPNGDSI